MKVEITQDQAFVFAVLAEKRDDLVRKLAMIDRSISAVIHAFLPDSALGDNYDVKQVDGRYFVFEGEKNETED